jgi:tetratricopeptide (TPR) repeat protein
MNPLQAVPALDADGLAALRRRSKGLQPAQAQRLKQVATALAAGDSLQSGQWLLALSLQAPSHPEVQRWRGLRHAWLGEWPDAASCLGAAAAAQGDDLDLRLRLAHALNNAGDFDAARHALEPLRVLATTAAEHLALAQEADRQGHTGLALAAAEAALALDPHSAVARLQRARSRMALGDGDGAAADCRHLIHHGRLGAAAWFLLVDLKTIRLQDAERQALQAAADGATGHQEQVWLQFALGKALEDAGEADAALAALHRANAQVRQVEPWDAARFSHSVDAVLAAFEAATPLPVDGPGAEVVFLVGLPRSGSTLFEHILSRHPQVEGASELPYLQIVIERESRRRGTPFPAWVARATQADWLRLGQDYLALSQRWRQQRPVSTDKLPNNWLLAGALLRMLPGARLIDCRRDALETCWSCYKQLFAPGLASFSYDFVSLAGYANDHERAMRHWQQRHPERVWRLGYEALVQDPPTQVRRLLDAAGLPFDALCLDSSASTRAVRTPSALQVRQPLLKVSRPAAIYGERLAPLRALLHQGDSGLLPAQVFPASKHGG